MMQQQLNGPALFREFWEATRMLGQDAVRHPEAMFTLIALKRVSDRFDEETSAAMEFGLPRARAESDDTAHAYMVPAPARWSRIRDAADEKPGLMRRSIGDVLNSAGDALAQANCELHDSGLAGAGKVLWTELDWWEDAGAAEDALRRVILHLDRIDLSDRAVQSVNRQGQSVLGEAVDRLVEKCQTNRTAGVLRSGLSTRPDVAELMVALAPAREGLRVCDPAAGYGTILTTAVRELRRSGGNPAKTEFHAQDTSLKSLAAGKLLALLHGVRWRRWSARSAMSSPLLAEDGDLNEFELDRFNVVYLHPPFVQADWRPEGMDQRHPRFLRYGTPPPERRGDAAWLLHALDITADSGRAVVAVPMGVLYRGGADARIREGMVADDFVEAVIALPKSVFDEKGPAALVVLNRRKVQGRVGSVLFMDAGGDEFHAKSGQSKRPRLTPGAMRRIVDGFHLYGDVDDFSRVVTSSEIRDEGYSLAPLRYLHGGGGPRVDLEQALADMRDAERRRDEAAARMNAILEEMGYTVPD